MTLNKHFILILILAAATACSHRMQPQRLQYQEYRIGAGAATDTLMQKMLQPYRDSVHRNMSQVVGTAATTLQKTPPAGSLGNFMADALLVMAREQYRRPVHFSILNYGSIRINELAQGPITRGKVFELMPFDNMLVLQQLNAAQVQQLFDHMAVRGGWPVAGATCTISNNKATDIQIGGNPLHADSSYTIANSDYVANGGDDAAFLKPIPQINNGSLMRDALLTYIGRLQQRGKMVEANNENRIRHAQ